MNCPEASDDIVHYVELSISQKIKDPKLSVGDQALVPMIKKSLCDGAHGMCVRKDDL